MPCPRNQDHEEGHHDEDRGAKAQKDPFHFWVDETQKKTVTCSAGTRKIKRTVAYFPVNSFFTVSLTSLPSTRAPANFAITFFITVPISFIVGEPISAMVALTVAMTSASLTALGM